MHAEEEPFVQAWCLKEGKPVLRKMYPAKKKIKYGSDPWSFY